MKVRYSLDKIGIGGIIVTALFSPCCFPLFAFVGSALGLGTFELFGNWTMWVLIAMVVVTVAGMVFSYRIHRCLYPLAIAVPGALLIAYGFYTMSISPFMYIGMFLMLAATAVNYYRFKLHNTPCCAGIQGKTVQLHSQITCPVCNHVQEEIMPDDSCVFFYDCKKCSALLTPLQGDCCVYCSYGSVPCPPIQTGSCC